KIEGKVKDMLVTEPSLCQLLSSIGRGRNHDATSWATTPHLVHQTADRQYLPNRNGVIPNCRLRTWPRKRRRNASQTLQKTASIFPVSNHLKNPIGKTKKQSCGE